MPTHPLRLVLPESVWGDDEGPPPDAEGRPTVQLTHEVHRALEQFDEYLGPRDPLLYQRAHELVTVAGANGRSQLASGTPVVRTMSSAALLPRVTRFVQCKKFQPGKDDEPATWVNTQPPRPLLASFLEVPDWKHVRYLRGVTESPIFRPDGTIRTEPGYDLGTGYLYVPACDYPEIALEPTQAEAQNALRDLVDVFCDFPYVDDASRHVPISAILSVLARAAIDGPVPGHLFDASVMGSGKTIQCDVAHLVAVGRLPAHATWPSKEEEQEKLLSSYALAAPAGIVLDNVKGVFGGAAVEQTLTSTSVEFRMLGGLSIRTLPWLAVVMISGNNIALTDDMLRRTLLSRLESPLEDPTTRTDFKRPELLEWVAKERPRLVALALTMLRAYAAKGFPDTGARLASYGAWARVVAGSILFAGGADVTKAQPPKERAALDDSGAAATIASLLPRLTSEPITVKALLSRLYPAPGPNDAPDTWDDLREAIEALAPTRGNMAPPAKAVAQRLSKFRGRWFGNRRLSSRQDGHSGLTVWWSESR